MQCFFYPSPGDFFSPGKKFVFPGKRFFGSPGKNLGVPGEEIDGISVNNGTILVFSADKKIDLGYPRRIQTFAVKQHTHS